jgi:hypothetical protein
MHKERRRERRELRELCNCLVKWLLQGFSNFRMNTQLRRERSMEGEWNIVSADTPADNL